MSIVPALDKTDLPASRTKPVRKRSDRERLLAALESAPRLTDEDAECIMQSVVEAREASIGDPLPV